MISDNRKREILDAFGASPGRENPEKVPTFSLTELLDAERTLGDWNPDAKFRVALRERIAELQRRSYESKDDTLSIWVKAFAFIVATGLLVGLLKEFGSYVLDLL